MKDPEPLKTIYVLLRIIEQKENEGARLCPAEARAIATAHQTLVRRRRDHVMAGGDTEETRALGEYSTVVAEYARGLNQFH